MFDNKTYQKEYRRTHKKQRLEYLKKNKESVKLVGKKYSNTHKEKRVAWRKRNRLHINQYDRNRYKKCTVELRKQRARKDHLKNSEYYIKYSKQQTKTCRLEWLKNNPDKVHKYNINRLHKYSSILNMTSMEYRWTLTSWSEIVKYRDNYTCLDCDSKYKLEAHHVLPKSKFPEFTFVPSNGITLCKSCHYEYTWGNKK